MQKAIPNSLDVNQGRHRGSEAMLLQYMHRPGGFKSTGRDTGVDDETIQPKASEAKIDAPHSGRAQQHHSGKTSCFGE